ncbi:SigE family RNA polymerase sigma factor [Tenggerimyces flavus]|uniref:SigE family RNA polymerase sigma factor n=1 Tax=Tenggerimyces flavus TaxID=1708749 RepID=A0ABV7YF27_9ACTN|nr:SigE family RNA polymerase sigma factor [Tenggerimyces flavus]MBM7789196.1 RNA polymerase sigma-70 factor (sigma-E family) [Tenggerimyces flavus]
MPIEPERVSREDAFADFVRARWSAAMRFAYALTLDHGHAEDLAQDSFAKLWFRWSRARDGNPEGYLRRIMTSTFLASRRRRWWGEHPSAQLPDVAAREAHSRVDDWDALRRAMRELSPRQRAAVFLRYAEDRSEQEVADLLGCSVGTVKQHTSRGLASLRSSGLDVTATLESVPGGEEHA